MSSSSRIVVTATPAPTVKLAVVEAIETFKVSSSVLPSTSKFSPIFTLFSTPIPPSTTREPLSLLVDSVCPDTIKGSLILTLASESITKFPVPDLVLIVFVFTITLPRVEIPATFKFSISMVLTSSVCTVAIPETPRFWVVIAAPTVKFLSIPTPPSI